MEAVLLVCTFAAFALTVTGAPAYTDSQEAQLIRHYHDEYPYYRAPRSQYASQYVAPCAAASAAAAAAVRPIHIPEFAAPYHLNVPGYAVPQYAVPQYSPPQYRTNEEMAESEMLAFSDMDQFQHGPAMMVDHIPMARSRYGSPSLPLASGYGLRNQVLTTSSGPAYGIFPNGNVGECNVPLLFSCSPSISSGHMVESQSHYSGGEAAVAASNTYRLVEDQPHSHDNQRHDTHHQSEDVLARKDPVRVQASSTVQQDEVQTQVPS